MSVSSRPGITCTLEKTVQEIQSLLSSSEVEIQAAGTQFEGLAHQTEAIVGLAAGVIGCVEEQSIDSILPKVQALDAAARSFIHARVAATSGILDTASAEVKLLDALSQLTRKQRSIARETQTLSVLTNIEVARLGQLGVGFQYLAKQLDEFSQSVAASTRELSSHTDERKTAIENTRRTLAVGLPRMRQEFARIEADLADALGVVGSSLNQLAQTPEQFRGCVSEIAAQIAHVVAAIQAHDITRQQLEHVQQALELITVQLGKVYDQEPQASEELPRISAGMLVQVCQLKSIETTVTGWVFQLRSCIDGILQISASEIVGIGPVVLEQEQALSKQLARIEALERECQQETVGVEETLAGLSQLMQLVSEHLERSKLVRDRLQLLTFNSIIEASHLGSKADAILEISQSIKRISVAWSEITDQSAHVKEEMLVLVDQAREGMHVFSEAGSDGLRAARAEASASLERLRTAAAFAASQALQIEGVIGELRARITEVSATGDRLDATFAHLGSVPAEIEEMKRQFEAEFPHSLGLSNREELEATFSASYTTEAERDIMRAALRGEPPPLMRQSFVGNEVEFF